jgi:hypothetical protein
MHQLRGVPREWQLYGVDIIEAPGSNRIVPDTRERRVMGKGARSDPD